MTLIRDHLRQTEDIADDDEICEPQNTDVLRFLFTGLPATPLGVIEGAFAQGIMHTIEVVYRREGFRDKMAYFEISTDKGTSHEKMQTHIDQRTQMIPPLA